MITNDRLEAARIRQVDIYGLDVASMDASGFAAYMAEQVASLFVEVGEFAEELPYRQWKMVAVDNTKLLAELADILIYITNILAGLDITEDEVRRALEAKIVYNLERHANVRT